MNMKVCCRLKVFSLPRPPPLHPRTNFWKSLPSYCPDPDGKIWAKNQTVNVSHSKSLYQFVVSFKAHLHARNQHHSSIHYWYIADLILRTTFGRNRCAWPDTYEGNESNRCLCIPNYMQKINIMHKFILFSFILRFILICCFESL